MGKQHTLATLLFSVIIILGLLSFTLCITAEFRRTKKEALRFEGKLCNLPASAAFSLGFAALILLVIAQIMANLFICTSPQGIFSTKQPTLAIILQAFSWVSFGVSIIILSVAASMSKTQEYGEGWVDGECYIVKDGMFIGSGVLVLVTLISLLTAALFTIKKS